MANSLPTWTYENSNQRAQRQAAQFQQLIAEIKPWVAQGDYQTAQAIVQSRVPEVAQPPASKPKKSGGGGFLGNVRDIGAGLLDAGKVVGENLLSGEKFQDTLGINTDYMDSLRKHGILGKAASFAIDTATAPATLLTLGAGSQISAGLKAGTAGTKLALAGKVGGSLLEPALEGPLARRAIAEIGAGVGGGLASDLATSHLPEGTPAPLRLGVGLGAGLLGGVAGLQAGNVGAGARTLAGEAATPEARALATVDERAGVSRLDQAGGPPGGTVLDTNPPPLAEPAIAGAAVVPDILNLPAITPTPLSRTDRAMNAIKRTLGHGVEEDTIATPAMRYRAQTKPVVDSQAARVGAKADAIVSQAFERDAKGRITTLPGQPTIQDVAARLPEYREHLEPPQLQAMNELAHEVGPYGELLQRVGVEFGSREDVMEGGFYLPRGRADLEGADAPVKVSGRGGMAGTRKGFEKSAEFPSMMAGLDAGYEYAPFADAMASYARDAGTRSMDQHVANYFKTVTDEDGNLIAQTAADRLDPVLRGEYQDAVADVANIRGRLNTALKRAKVAAGKADELDKAVSDIGERVPTDAGQMANLPGIAEREGQRADRLRANPDSPAATTFERRANTIESVVKKFDAAIPADADRIRYLENAINRSARRVSDLRARGGEYAAVADDLEASLNAARARLEELRPRYHDAVEKARQTPRGQGTIAIASLNGNTFPESVANAANKYIRAEQPVSGRGAVLPATIDALNTLLRGLRASADVSFMGVQGVLGAVRDPMGYGKALAVAYKSIADPQALGQYLRDFDKRALSAGRMDSRAWAERGLHLGGIDTEFQVGRGIAGKAGEALRNAPVLKQSNRMFGYFGDTMRLELAETMLDSAARRGLDITNSSVLSEIADAANRATGWSRNTFAGDLGQLAQFAPRFFQSQLETVAKAFTDGGVEGTEARRMLGSLLGISVGLTVLANETSDQPLSYKELLDPTSANFLRFRIKGQDVSILGPWDSLLRGAMAIAPIDPVQAAQGDLGEAFKKPDFAYLMRSKASPVIGMGWDLFSGKNFVGEDTRTPENFARSFLPFSLRDVGEKPALGTAIGATGIKSTPMTPTEQLDTIARTVIDPETGQPNRKGFYDSSPAVKQIIKDDHPDTWQRAVEKGSQKRQQYEEAKNVYRTQQEGDNELLLSGKLTRQQWQQQMANRRQQLIGQGAAIYGEGGRVQTGDKVLDAFYQQIQDSTVNGAPQWDAVYNWVDSLPEKDRTHIETNTGLNQTPLEKLTKRLSGDYYSLPQYRGYTADEGKAINDLLAEVNSRAPGGDDLRQLSALRKLVASGEYDERAVKGARRAILHQLADDTQRKKFAKAHPELALVTRQGTLTPADMTAIRAALEAA